MRNHYLSINVALSDEAVRYLESCCNIRQCTKTRLFGHLISVILEEKLVLATLDDDSAPMPVVKGCHRNKRYELGRHPRGPGPSSADGGPEPLPSFASRTTLQGAT